MLFLKRHFFFTVFVIYVGICFYVKLILLDYIKNCVKKVLSCRKFRYGLKYANRVYAYYIQMIFKLTLMDDFECLPM